MQRKPLTVKKVLIMGVITGISVIIIAYFAMYMQHRRLVQASRGGTLPKAAQLTNPQPYAEDGEGRLYYVIEGAGAAPEGQARAWSRLIYAEEGKKAYITKRRQRNMFTEGFDRLAHRDILYEFKCAKDPREYAIIEVFEVDREGKTLDYGKTGSSKDWEAIPQGTTIEKLALKACPSTAK